MLDLMSKKVMQEKTYGTSKGKTMSVKEFKDMAEEYTPKGMVRTEMGRLVNKADQDAWDKKATESMNQEYFSRGKKLSSMKKKSFPDLNKDGKVTKADVLKGRGVIK